MKQLCIVGFGLIGGSLGLAARARGAVERVTAVDRPDVLALARERKFADEFVDMNDEEASVRALAASDMTILAAPVWVISERVEWALSHANLVTDCGSTKRRIVERARRSPRAGRFVPGHPMAGLPHGGTSSARADLFEGSAWLLCPSGSEPDAVLSVERLVSTIGARPVFLDADAHDAAVARTSHLPQLLASALTVVAARHASAAAGPAFERATRAAGGPEPIWHDIFGSNADEIARAIRELCAELEPIAGELADGGRTSRADALLERARRLRS